MTNAGWYPSPTTPGMEQFWDGGSWTPQFRPVSAAPFGAPAVHHADTVVSAPMAAGSPPSVQPPSRGPKVALLAVLGLLGVLLIGGLALFLVVGRDSESAEPPRAGTAAGGSTTASTDTDPAGQNPEVGADPADDARDDGNASGSGGFDSVPLGEILDTGSSRLLVHEVAFVEPANEFAVPDAGKVFVVVDLEITNVSNDVELFSTFNSEAFDDDGFSYDADFNNPRRNPPLGHLLPGQTRRGDVTFQIPEGASLSYLVIKESFDNSNPQSMDLTGESAGQTSTALDGSGPTKPADAAPLGQEVESPTFRYLIHESMAYVSDDTFIQPREGFEFVIVDVEVTNLTDEAQTSTLFDVEAFDGQGFSYTADFLSPRNDSPLGDFLAGQNRRGDLTFQIPEGAELSYLVFSGFLSDQAPVSLSLD